MPHRKFHCEVYTPTQQVVDAEAVHVQFPAADGQVGVLGGRSPMIAMLGVGEIELTPAQGAEQLFFVARGFARMENDRLIFLAEECIPTPRLNAEAAWEELQQAQQLPARTDRETAIRQAQIDMARGKFNAAQRHRRRAGLISKPRFEE